MRGSDTSSEEDACERDSEGSSDMSSDQVSPCCMGHAWGTMQDDDLPNTHAQEVQVDFEARAVSEEDFHGICRLLRQV